MINEPPSESVCEMCGQPLHPEDGPPQKEHDLLELITALAELNERDFISTQLIMLFVRHPRISLREATDDLSERFGHTWGFSPHFIGKKIKKICADYPTLDKFFAVDKKSATSQVSRRQFEHAQYVKSLCKGIFRDYCKRRDSGAAIS